MRKNNFDLVMDYIDNNIHLETEEIKREIYRLIGYTSKDFGDCFKVLTNGETLFRYISERRVYIAAQELISNPGISIATVAAKYYSEQSAFTRAMKTFFGCTPDKVRKGTCSIPDNKYYLDRFTSHSKDEFEQNSSMIDILDRMSQYDFEILDHLEETSKHLGFDYDIDTVYLIKELADKLDISALDLVHACGEIILDDIVAQQDPDYIPPHVIHAAECGIESDEELKAICEYYNCKYYDIDYFMVDYYRNYRLTEENN